MKARFAKLSALGASAGLAVALVAGSAAMAATHNGGKKSSPAPAPAYTYSCATFSGLKLTQQSVSYNSVSLQAGQVITANLSGAPSGSYIDLTTALGTSIGFYDAPASTGLAFRAPSSGVYNLAWSLDSSATPTTPLSWSFQCS